MKLYKAIFYYKGKIVGIGHGKAKNKKEAELKAQFTNGAMNTLWDDLVIEEVNESQKIKT